MAVISLKYAQKAEYFARAKLEGQKSFKHAVFSNCKPIKPTKACDGKLPTQSHVTD